MLDRISRRELLKVSGAALATGGTSRIHAGSTRPLFGNEAGSHACIMIFLKGGPSQLETWDPKPGHPNGGPTQAISTRIPGVAFAEYWPRLASLADQLSILRTVTGTETDHRRAFHAMHTGTRFSESQNAPHLGSLLASQRQRFCSGFSSELPAFVSFGRTTGPGDLGPAAAPLVVTGQELVTGRIETRQRFDERMRLAAGLKRLKANTAGQAAYGNSRFAGECLLASQLVSSGVSFVEIVHDGWDHHDGLWQKLPAMAAEVDQGLSALISDLRTTGLLEQTTIVCLGEFGRSPAVNTRTPGVGRDHWAKNFAVLLAGAGVQQGSCLGVTSADGREIVESPVTVDELFHQLRSSLGVHDFAVRNRQNGQFRTDFQL